MVLVANNPSCSCPKAIIDIEPREVIYPESRRCELLRTEKNRKRPPTCHNYHPQVGVECS